MKIQALKIKSPQLGIFDNGGSGVRRIIVYRDSLTAINPLKTQ